MKIAAITEDGRTISQHFGRAPYYMVVTVEDGNITNHDLRDKMGHVHFKTESQGHEEPGELHGYGPNADNRHARMAESIIDCEAILCRGMGMGAYENMKKRNMRPIVTTIADIDEAVLAYTRGEIVDHIEKLH